MRETTEWQSVWAPISDIINRTQKKNIQQFSSNIITSSKYVSGEHVCVIDDFFFFFKILIVV